MRWNYSHIDRLPLYGDSDGDRCKNEHRELGSEPLYRFATGSLRIKYLKPTPTAMPITLKARVTNIKDQRIYSLSCHVWVLDEVTAQAEVVAFLVYRSDQVAGNHLAFHSD